MSARSLLLVLALVGAGCALPESKTISGGGDDDAGTAIDAPAGTVDASVDADVDAADVDAEPACQNADTRCEGNTVTECQAGTWTPTAVCPNLCSDGQCVVPPSCNGGVVTCGATGTVSCCRSLPVEGGTFSRSYDAVTAGFTDPQFTATVTSFSLDAYEVSVARFQAFVSAYPASKPATGTGGNSHDAADTGWNASWTALLPNTQADLNTSLLCEGLASQAVTDPVRCVSWYVAQAFCIWDGGRLPTEAEWNYAAAGGNNQRVYPWSSPPSNNAIATSNAVYSPQTAPSAPGSHSIAGDARWSHTDLAGNVAEWAYDYYATPYPTTSCADCANHSAAAFRALRGGSFANGSVALIVSLRSSLDPASTRKSVGFRCARNPVP